MSPPRGLDRLVWVQTFDDVDAHPVQDRDVNRIPHAFPSRTRIPVDVEIVADERRQPLVHPRNRVGVITRDRQVDRSDGGAPPSAGGVKTRGVARDHTYTRL